eukprot:764921-Prymnesium_polylepis.1
MFVAGLPASWIYIHHRKRNSASERQLRGFSDRVVALAMIIGLVSYPVLSSRLLKIFVCEQYGSHNVLAADLSMSCDQARGYYPGAFVFLMLHTAGLPVLFFLILRHAAMPLAHQQKVLLQIANNGMVASASKKGDHSWRPKSTRGERASESPPSLMRRSADLDAAGLDAALGGKSTAERKKEKNRR